MTNPPVSSRASFRDKKSRKPVPIPANKPLIEPKLLEMVRLRVAQICHSKSCMEVHTKALKAHRESPERIQQLVAWQGNSLYSDREQAALAISEALSSDLPKTLPANVVHQAQAHLSDPEIVHLTLAILAVIDWNYPHAEERHS